MTAEVIPEVRRAGNMKRLFTTYCLNCCRWRCSPIHLLRRLSGRCDDGAALNRALFNTWWPEARWLRYGEQR